MPKYDVSIKGTTFKDASIFTNGDYEKAFLDQMDEVVQKLTGYEAGLDDFQHRLFGIEDDGKVRKMEASPNNYRVRMARDNRLFFKDEDDNLRQIGFEKNGDEITVTVSDPIPFKNPIEMPKSPSLWTYIKALFNNEAKAEVKAYWEARSFRNCIRRLIDDYSFEREPEPKKLEEDAPTKRTDSKTMEQESMKTNAVTAGSIGKKLTFQKKSAAEFKSDLESIYKEGNNPSGKSPDEVVFETYTEGNLSGKYLDSLKQMLDVQIAGQFLQREDTDYDKVQDTYWLMRNPLEKYVKQYVIDKHFEGDEAKMNEYFTGIEEKVKGFGGEKEKRQEAYKEVKEKFEEIRNDVRTNCLSVYVNEVTKENKTRNKESQKLTTSPAKQPTQVQVQTSQPSKESGGMGMGGKS